MRLKAILITLFIVSCCYSQQKNKFLNREFWKNNPTIETIDKLIKEGNSITQKNRHAMNGICYAILEEIDLETIKKIIAKKIDINETTHDKRTYIFWAAYKNNLKLVKLLFKKGARNDIFDSKGYSLIQFTAIAGNNNIKMYDLLIKKGADIKALDKKGRNIALLYAGKFRSDLKFLEYFVNKGININQIDKEGNNIFTYACKTRDKKVLEGLIKKGISYKTQSNATENAFTMLTGYSHGKKTKISIEVLNYLDELGFNPKFTNNKGNTALHNLAYTSKDSLVFTYFINKGLDVNKKNNKGNTAYSNAALINTKKILVLLKQGLKDINSKNKKGRSALTRAIRRNKMEVVSYLIESGAKVTIEDSKGNDLFYHLVDSFRASKIQGFNEKYNILQKNGLNISKSKAILHLAVKKRRKDIINKIISKKIDINGKNKDGYTALQTLVMCAKNTQLIKELIDKGASKIKTPEGESIYDLALENELLNNNQIEFLK